MMTIIMCQWWWSAKGYHTLTVSRLTAFAVAVGQTDCWPRFRGRRQRRRDYYNNDRYIVKSRDNLPIVNYTMFVQFKITKLYSQCVDTESVDFIAQMPRNYSINTNYVLMSKSVQYQFIKSCVYFTSFQHHAILIIIMIVHYSIVDIRRPIMNQVCAMLFYIDSKIIYIYPAFEPLQPRMSLNKVKDNQFIPSTCPLFCYAPSTLSLSHFYFIIFFRFITNNCN